MKNLMSVALILWIASSLGLPASTALANDYQNAHEIEIAAVKKANLEEMRAKLAEEQGRLVMENEMTAVEIPAPDKMSSSLSAATLEDEAPKKKASASQNRAQEVARKYLPKGALKISATKEGQILEAETAFESSLGDVKSTAIFGNENIETLVSTTTSKNGTLVSKKEITYWPNSETVNIDRREAYGDSGKLQLASTILKDARGRLMAENETIYDLQGNKIKEKSRHYENGYYANTTVIFYDEEGNSRGKRSALDKIQSSGLKVNKSQEKINRETIAKKTDASQKQIVVTAQCTNGFGMTYSQQRGLCFNEKVKRHKEKTITQQKPGGPIFKTSITPWRDPKSGDEAGTITVVTTYDVSGKPIRTMQNIKKGDRWLSVLG